MAGLAFESTIPFPIPSTWYDDFLKRSYLFPVIGAILGGLAGSIGLGCALLPPFLGAAFYIISLYLWNGIIHPDGLADFTDGLLCGEDREGRLEVMKDGKTGPAGIIALVTINILLFAGLRELFASATPKEIFYTLWGGEVLAKYSFLLPISFGSSANPGMGAEFIKKSTRSYFFTDTIFVGGLMWVIWGWPGLVPLSIGLTIAAMLSSLGTNILGGVNGDVLGAIHEIIRPVSLISFMLIVNYGVTLPDFL